MRMIPILQLLQHHALNKNEKNNQFFESVKRLIKNKKNLKTENSRNRLIAGFQCLLTLCSLQLYPCEQTFYALSWNPLQIQISLPPPEIQNVLKFPLFLLIDSRIQTDNVLFFFICQQMSRSDMYLEIKSYFKDNLPALGILPIFAFLALSVLQPLPLLLQN